MTSTPCVEIERASRTSSTLDALRSCPVHRIGFGVGVILALLVIGPGFGLGAWVNLDQTVLPKMAVPNSLFGLGPELPRRALFTTIPALFSFMGAAALVMKIIVVALFGFAVAGICRWLERCHMLVALGAGALYVLSPFVITRLSIGHLGLIWAAAYLPHALKAWLDPSVRWPKVFLYAVLLSLGGQLAGSVVIIVVPAVLIARGFRRGAVPMMLILFAQLSWAMSGWGISTASGFSQPNSVDFPTRVSGWLAPLRVVAGEGYFHTTASPTPYSARLSALIGLLILVLCLVGVITRAKAIPSRLVWALVWVVAIGMLMTMATTNSVGQEIFEKVTSNRYANLWREGQRTFLPAWMVLCLGLGVGAQRLGERVRAFDLVGWAVPLSIAFIAVGPNVWGAQGMLDNFVVPAGWSTARSAIHADPGSTLVVPSDQYISVPWANNRTSHQLFGSYVGGDLISSSDAGSANGGGEIDDRMEVMWSAMLKWGFQPEGQLTDILKPMGVKWVVRLKTDSGMSFVPLDDDENLTTIVETSQLTLFRVEGVTLAAGHGHKIDAREVWPGVIIADSERAAFLARSGAGGWMRGWSAGSRTGAGHVHFDAGSKVIWYWPAVLTQATLLAMALASGIAVGAARQPHSSSEGKLDGSQPERV